MTSTHVLSTQELEEIRDRAFNLGDPQEISREDLLNLLHTIQELTTTLTQLLRASRYAAERAGITTSDTPTKSP
jgi:hypothetical protein